MNCPKCKNNLKENLVFVENGSHFSEVNLDPHGDIQYLEVDFEPDYDRGFYICNSCRKVLSELDSIDEKKLKEILK